MANSEIQMMRRWQSGLLPLMRGVVVLLTIAFLCIGVYELHRLDERFDDRPNAVGEIIHRLVDPSTATTAEDHRWRSIVALETYALQSRYHQANLVLISRIWVRFIGFLTGMTLSLVGAAFILGKLSESESRLETEGTAGKFVLATTSPGLTLAVLGTILILSSLLVRSEISVDDGALYIHGSPSSDPITQGTAASLRANPGARSTAETSSVAAKLPQTDAGKRVGTRGPASAEDIDAPAIQCGDLHLDRAYCDFRPEEFIDRKWMDYRSVVHLYAAARDLAQNAPLVEYLGDTNSIVARIAENAKLFIVEPPYADRLRSAQSADELAALLKEYVDYHRNAYRSKAAKTG